MAYRIAVTASLSAAAFALSGCGGAGGDAFYADLNERCYEGFGEGQDENAAIFCPCQDKKLREQEVGPMDLFDDSVMRDIDMECSREVMDAQFGG